MRGLVGKGLESLFCIQVWLSFTTIEYFKESGKIRTDENKNEKGIINSWSIFFFEIQPPGCTLECLMIKTYI